MISAGKLLVIHAIFRGTQEPYRYLHACKAVWSGLPTLYQEQAKEVVNSCLDDQYEISELIVRSIDVRAGFVLTDPKDPRYRAVVNHRTRFGNVIQRAATKLQLSTEGEDHTDAVMAVARAIEVFLLEYAISREDFDKLEKNYTQTRE